MNLRVLGAVGYHHEGSLPQLPVGAELLQAAHDRVALVFLERAGAVAATCGGFLRGGGGRQKKT